MFGDNPILLILLIAFAFAAFLLMLVILVKKNIIPLAPNPPEESNSGKPKANYHGNHNNNEILEENRRLKNKIEQLENKNIELEMKINELQSTNVDLEKQRELLLANKKKLEGLQKQKDDLFSMVVHDIKNPAAAIKNFVELLESYDLNATEQHEIMKNLLTTSSRILKLAQEVNEVITFEHTLIKLKFDRVDIKELIDNAVERYLSLARMKKVTLDFEEVKVSLEADVDGEKIDKVLDNLVSNAIKFAPKETRVFIKAQKLGDNIVVEVSDNGYGLSQKEVERAFEKGVQLENKPTGGESSSGLGLWIVKRIVEEHQGRVWVKSKRGAGSTFAFQVPITHDDIKEE